MVDVASEEISADLLSVLSMELKLGESAANFTARVVGKAQKCSQDKWGELQEETQQWVNQWLTLQEQEGADPSDLPLLVAEEDEGIPEFLDRRKSNGKAANGTKHEAEPPPKVAKKSESKDMSEDDLGTKRQGRPPSEWSVKKAYELCKNLVLQLQKAGIQVRERKGTSFLNREQAHAALEKLQASFEEAGIDPGEDLAKAMEAMEGRGAGGRPAVESASQKSAKAKPVEKGGYFGKKKPALQTAPPVRKIEAKPSTQIDTAEPQKQEGLDPVFVRLLERFPKSGASKRERELWLSLLKGSLELFG
jgi:hypothetical protein